jgi:hypothetical protein
MTAAVNVRAKLVDLMRRDLIGPHPDLDPDLAREVLQDEKPSRWYVGGFIVPVYDGVASAAKEEDADEAAEDAGDDLLGSETLDSSLDDDADEKDGADPPPRDRFLPSSIALTVILPEAVREVTVRATWGDYKTEPPLPDALLIPDYSTVEGEQKPEKPASLRWVRIPGEATIKLDVTRSRSGIPLPGSSAPQRPGGGLEIAVHQRPFAQTTPEGTTERLRMVTVFLVNRRKRAKAPIPTWPTASRPASNSNAQTASGPAATFPPTSRTSSTCGSATCTIATSPNMRSAATRRAAGTKRTTPLGIACR